MNSKNMTPATTKAIKAKNDCHTLLLIQNYVNFKRSGEPIRFMYYEDDGSWVKFRQDVFGWLKSGFLEGKALLEVQTNGLMWIFDFYRMVQIDLESGQQRSIAWIDVNGKCFFPKKFVCSGGNANAEQIVKISKVKEHLRSGVPKIDIEITIDGKIVNLGKRTREGGEPETKGVKEDKAEGSWENGQRGRAKRRELIDSGVVDQPRWPKTKLLKEGDTFFSAVKSLFLSVLRIEPDAAITAVHLFSGSPSNPVDKSRLEVFNKQMEITKNARGNANMTRAWHGTSATSVKTILSHGFVIPTEVPDSQPYGVGVYLSPLNTPQISAMLSEVDENGEKHLILCRLILGKCEKVVSGSKQSYPSSEDFDTGVDDLQNPRLYVVWCTNINTRILPECVVSYKSSGRLKGQFNGSSTANLNSHQINLFLDKLFSKLGCSLPPSKAQQLRTLCSTYKNGKLGKDNFLRQLRSVVGNEMLHSTIREIHG